MVGDDVLVDAAAAGELKDGDEACDADGCSAGIAECQSPEPAVGAVAGDTGVGVTCGAIGGVGGIPPAPGGISTASTWWEKSVGIMLGGAMPCNAAAFRGIPEAGPVGMPE